MSEPDPLALVHRYLDDVASDAECAKLERWLCEDPANVRAFARAAHLDQRIRDQLEEADLRDLLGPTQADEVDTDAIAHAAMSSVPGSAPVEPKRRRTIGLALAAIGIAGAAALGGYYLAGGPTPAAKTDLLSQRLEGTPDTGDTKAGKAAHQRWLAFSERLREDPALIAYYAFELDPARPDTLVNQAAVTTDQFDGHLGRPDHPDTAPRWSAGRFPGHLALDFDGADKQHVVLPHAEGLNLSAPCTVSLWVYNDTPIWTAHLLTKRAYHPDGGYFSNIAIAWVGVDPVHHGGRRTYYYTFEFGDVGPNRAWTGPHESPEGLPETSQWVNLTVTYDGNQIVYYRDGERTQAKPVENNHVMPDIDGDLIIGDSTTVDSQLKNSFDGRIDEVVLLGRVWSDAEARAFYEAGRPAEQ
ncbi:MAG: LamG-like jellyroll fold domain-containing protein [Planctomycetota bacterium]